MNQIRVLLVSLAFTPTLTSAKGLTCAALLKRPSALKAQAAVARLLEDDADEARAYGYVGVSDGELLELLNTGRIRAPLVQRITTDHPAFARLNAVAWPAAVRASIRDAWIRSIHQVWRGQAPGASIDLAKVSAVLEHLALTRDGDRLSASFEDIERALERARVPGLGPGRWARARRMAYWLGVPWPADFKRGGASERALVARFSYLPSGAGARLIMSERVADRLKFAHGTFVISDLDVRDVIAIRPNSPAADEFLESVRVAGTTGAPALK